MTMVFSFCQMSTEAGRCSLQEDHGISTVRWPVNYGSPLQMARVEKQRSKAEQKPIKCREIRRASPRTVDDQELLFHEQAVSDGSPRTIGSYEFGERSQKEGEVYQQILHGRAGQGRMISGTGLSRLPFSVDNYQFVASGTGG
jgi:hypothetical protein